MSRSKPGMEVIKADNNLYKIVYRRGKGSVPKELRTLYTRPNEAQRAIDNFYQSAKNKSK